MLTADDLRVIWSLGPAPDGTDDRASLGDLVVADDRDTLTQLRSVLVGSNEASATAPSGTTYHVLDGRSDLDENGLLWWWRLSPVDAQPIADERAALLEQAVNRFLFDLRMLGFGVDGAIGRRLPGMDGLSPRERAVVEALVRGGRTVTIARELFVSQSTVRSHLSSAFRKLGVSSQAELMERLGSGTVDLRDPLLTDGLLTDGLVEVDGRRPFDPDPAALDPTVLDPKALDEPV